MLDAEARRVAEDLASLPASQLRRFYGSAMALRRRLELDTDRKVPDEEIRSHLALLKAQAAYTQKRNSRYPKELVRFFTLHAASVQNRVDFLRGFQPHFEAVVAYHKVFEQKGNGE
jgi:CRISPR type III-A-associated protein Csm2